MKRIYISGGMSGLPNLNFPAFNAEAARLRALGYTVINPAEINVGPVPVPFASMTPCEQRAHWRSCMRLDLVEMLTCDTVALLPGWERSKGASLEQYIATELGMEACMSAEIVDECEQLTAEQTIVLRARHWYQTAAGLEAARIQDQRQAAAAHDQATKFLRMAVEAGVREGGAA